MNSLSLFSRYNPPELKLSLSLSLSFYNLSALSTSVVVPPVMNNKSYLFACFLITGRGEASGSVFHPVERGEVGGNLAGNFGDDDRGGGS